MLHLLQNLRLRLLRDLHFKVYKAKRLRLLTKSGSAHQDSRRAALPVRFANKACSNDQFEVSKGWPARHFLELSIAHCSLCLPRSQRTPNTTKKCGARHEVCTSKYNRSDLLHLPHQVDFRPPKHADAVVSTKSDHQARKCATDHNESIVEASTRSGPPVRASLRNQSALRRSRGMNVL